MRLNLLFVILFIASNLVILPLYYRSEKQDFRGLVNFLNTQLIDGDKIFDKKSERTGDRRKSTVGTDLVMPDKSPETILQCDFDGTVTTEDVSFMLLDAFADGDWRKIHNEYHAAHMTVGEFNTRVFGMVKASRETMLNYARANVKIREGLNELAAACEKKGIKIVVVSNGLDFYIEEILKNAGLSHIESHAARTIFKPTGLNVAYINPEGQTVNDGFKEAYARLFLARGCQVIYAGDGFSDAGAAKLCHKIFAIGGLLKYCQQSNLPCSTFDKLTDIAKEIEKL